jgi:hypothetical protein
LVQTIWIRIAPDLGLWFWPIETLTPKASISDVGSLQVYYYLTRFSQGIYIIKREIPASPPVLSTPSIRISQYDIYQRLLSHACRDFCAKRGLNSKFISAMNRINPFAATKT